MKKMRRLLPLALAFLVFLLLTACKAPEEQEPAGQETEPVATAVPTPKATEKGWEPDPTITPRPMSEAVITPAPGEAIPKIHPIDRPPLNFEPYTYVEPEGLGVGFEIPASWELSMDEELPGTAIYNEVDALSGELVRSMIVVTVSNYGSAQTIDDARAKIDEDIQLLRSAYDGVEVSSKAEQRMLKQNGVYVTYWFTMKPDGQETSLKMRGRLHVVPVDKKLIIVRYACPADYNTDYVEVYKKLRETLVLL